MRNTRMATQVKQVRAMAPAVVGVGAVTPVEVDGTGYTRAMYTVNMGACGAGASTLSFKVQDAATSGGALADLTGAASAGLTKAAHENKVCVYDVPINSARPFQKITAAVGTDTWAMSCVVTLYRPLGSGGKAYPVNTAYATEIVIV